MANEEHVAILKKGVAAWNAWRDNLKIGPDPSPARLIAAFNFKADLSGSDLSDANLFRANLHEANLSNTELKGASLSGADLSGADLSGADLFNAGLIKADLSWAHLNRANLIKADLNGANLFRADLRGARLFDTGLIGANLFDACLIKADLRMADFSGANLRGADLRGANLFRAYLAKADLRGADLSGQTSARNAVEGEPSAPTLTEADLSGADLRGANLQGCPLVNVNLTHADLTGCRIFGISAWGLKLEGAKQQNLVITPENEPEITVDNIEVAQFIYLLLRNQKIREVIDTITSKAVLILGRFTEERKAVVDALRDELRNRNLLPILFDFAIPASRDVTETIKTLASLARFVIADVTDATEVRAELHNIVRDFPSLPIQPILLRGHPEFVSLSHLTNFPWVLPIFEYDHPEHLLASLGKIIVAPEAKVKALKEALEEGRRKIEAELTKGDAPAGSPGRMRALQRKGSNARSIQAVYVVHVLS
jgi:uncharacterized protein YjbI with pentapeptide repeats